ncbi:MAG: LAGLIDADG family homing endonuclease, partial [Candidatus Caldarchaeales archaeon]
SAFIYHKKSGGRAGIIVLAVKDIEFADHFARALGNVLKRKVQVREIVREGRTFYEVKACDLTLAELLTSKDINTVRRFVKHDVRTKIAFLRGIFDSESCVSGNGVCLYNTNHDLLKWVQKLLEELGILTTGPKLRQRAGTRREYNGLIIMLRRDYFHLRIRTASLLLFAVS